MGRLSTLEEPKLGLEGQVLEEVTKIVEKRAKFVPYSTSRVALQVFGPQNVLELLLAAIGGKIMPVGRAYRWIVYGDLLARALTKLLPGLKQEKFALGLKTISEEPAETTVGELQLLRDFAAKKGEQTRKAKAQTVAELLQEKGLEIDAYIPAGEELEKVEDTQLAAIEEGGIRIFRAIDAKQAESYAAIATLSGFEVERVGEVVLKIRKAS